MQNLINIIEIVKKLQSSLFHHIWIVIEDVF